MTALVVDCRDVLDNLRTLEPRVQRHVLVSALRAGARPVKRAIGELTPVGKTGRMRKSIKIRSAKRSRHRVAIDVGFGAHDYVGDVFYAAMLDHGTQDRYTRRVGKHGRAATAFLRGYKKAGFRGKVKPMLMIERAFASTSDTAKQIVMDQITAGVAKELARR